MGKGARLRQKRQSAIGSIDRDQRRALQKIIDEESAKVVTYWDDKYWGDIVSAVLWALHVSEGFNAKRLRRFYDRFDEVHNDLMEYYKSYDEFMSGPTCRVKLREIGVDVDKWKEESRQAKLRDLDVDTEKWEEMDKDGASGR